LLAPSPAERAANYIALLEGLPQNNHATDSDVWLS
jgi:hypothetical protein